MRLLSDPYVRVDFCFEPARLVVEVDGARWHQDVRRDRHRDNRLAAVGWRVLWYGWDAVVRGHGSMVEQVHRAIAAAAPTPTTHTPRRPRSPRPASG